MNQMPFYPLRFEPIYQYRLPKPQTPNPKPQTPNPKPRSTHWAKLLTELSDIYISNEADYLIPWIILFLKVRLM